MSEMSALFSDVLDKRQQYHTESSLDAVLLRGDEVKDSPEDPGDSNDHKPTTGRAIFKNIDSMLRDIPSVFKKNIKPGASHKVNRVEERVRKTKRQAQDGMPQSSIRQAQGGMPQSSIPHRRRVMRSGAVGRALIIPVE
mmetsp:Transcript_31931/g.46989  ORF Transcript_31931/g.46989 Transcript_31931/m.46989 type:complete len:139 (+) Transcript_31931:3-419(+)